MCKILECTQLADKPVPDVQYFYDNYRHERINRELMANQCLYCPYVDTSDDELYAHSVAAHPDYPIMIYSGITPKQTINGNDRDGKPLKDSIDRKRSAKKRSFDGL